MPVAGDMTIFNRSALLSHLRNQMSIDWFGHQGIAHWTRVRANGLMLAGDTGAIVHVVELFAFFHDARRVNEHVDYGHGARGAGATLGVQAQQEQALKQPIGEVCDSA